VHGDHKANVNDICGGPGAVKEARSPRDSVYI